ncbi:4-hydroxy-2-oxovalerate aldolase domain protein [Clostridioides difficile DA00165]|nr:4-hydroxy-2-oxovalerate aldolase domain protein [Clostridioides difficile DA00165]
MISHAAEICKNIRCPLLPTIGSIEEWVNIGANMLCLAQDTTFITYVINQLLSFYNEIVPIQKQH